MSRISFFLAGVLVGGAAVLTSLKYHVVRASDGFHMIPKQTSRFGEAYVDIRQFQISDWDQHRSLATAIMRSDKNYLLKDSAVGTVAGTVEQAMDTLSIPTGQQP